MSMNNETLTLILGVVSALVAVAGLIWTIIWAIRGPKLKLSLLDSKGELTRFGDSPKAPRTCFFHLRIANRRRWTAKNVSIKVRKIIKTTEKGKIEPQRIPVYLIWATHPAPKLYLIDVLGLDEEVCNLGYISKEDCLFKLDAMDPARYTQNEKWPPNFEGFLKEGEEMQIELVAVAENAKSNTLCLEITWDGPWQENPEEMKEKLKIKQIKSYNNLFRP